MQYHVSKETVGEWVRDGKNYNIYTYPTDTTTKHEHYVVEQTAKQ